MDETSKLAEKATTRQLRRKLPGQTIFSFNIHTGEIKPAKIMSKEPETNPYGYVISPKRTLIVVELDCIYRQALNKKSLIRKLRKEGFDNI